MESTDQASFTEIERRFQTELEPLLEKFHFEGGYNCCGCRIVREELILDPPDLSH
jgi:hypothetical protein